MDMRINLHINLEAKDNVLEAIKTVEKGVVANSLWKPTRKVLSEPKDIHNPKTNDSNFENSNNFKIEAFDKKFFSEKVTENQINNNEFLIEKSFEKIFGKNTSRNSFNQNNIDDITKFYVNKVFENTENSFWESKYFNDEKEISELNSDIKQNFMSDVSSVTNDEKDFSQNYFEKIKNNIFNKDTSISNSGIQISFEKFNRKNIFDNSISNESDNNSEVENKNSWYKKISDNKNHFTNTFYPNLVINCSSEEVENGSLKRVLDSHLQDILFLMSKMGGNNYD